MVGKVLYKCGFTLVSESLPASPIMVFVSLLLSAQVCGSHRLYIKGGSQAIFHHAVGGSIASVPELSVVLQEWAASALPELCTQVEIVYMCVCVEFNQND